MQYAEDVEEIHDSRLARLRAETRDYLPAQWDGLRERRHEDWCYLVDAGYRASLRRQPPKREPPPSESRVRSLVDAEAARHADSLWQKIVSHIQPIHEKLTRFNSMADAAVVAEQANRIRELETRLSAIEGRLAKAEGRTDANARHAANLEKKVGRLLHGAAGEEQP